MRAEDRVTAIGGVTLTSPYILAPMAGVTDMPFRLLCKRQGAALVCTEMVSANALHYGSLRTEGLLRTDPEERPVSVQIFGSDPEIMGEAAAYLSELPIDIIDINMGCPVPKVVKNGEGCALMLDVRLAASVIRSVVKNSAKPVTVKMRKGFDDAHVNAVEIAKAAEDAGASAVTVHARTRQQYYSGRADLDIIRRVKEAVSIPVIGNGDVTSPEAAVRMTRETGCDGVMIGRAARGDPWIFSRIMEYEKTGKVPPAPSAKERKQMALCHAAMQINYNGERQGVRQMRSRVSWYVSGLKNAAAVRRRINMAETFVELEEALKEVGKDE